MTTTTDINKKILNSLKRGTGEACLIAKENPGIDFSAYVIRITSYNVCYTKLLRYVTGIYPYYGPDVVYTQSQIPGGLQGLLIAWPLGWFGIPEAPYILLNILTFSVLVFFGWYISKRIPNVPRWFIFVWLLTSPWTLTYSTHIENPSYVIVGARNNFV